MNPIIDLHNIQNGFKTMTKSAVYIFIIFGCLMCLISNYAPPLISGPIIIIDLPVTLTCFPIHKL